jgi:chemotaxis protein MotA
VANPAKPDLATIGGVLVASLGIVGGLILEGGQIQDIVQVTAAIIVLGGTAGAVMVNTPLETLVGGLRRLVSVLLAPTAQANARIEELIELSTKARKTGLISLERDAYAAADPFLRKALTLAVDGSDLKDLRRMLELQIEMDEIRAEQEAKVFESAGGYAPTIGIIGAVLGLIQMMKHLSDVAEVGHGIAVAFVATVYGVAVANIFFLPAANKIKARIQEETHLKELTLEGVCGLLEGANPKLLRTRLEAYATPHAKKEARKAS